MKLLILTTDTPHHNYFVRKLINCNYEVILVYEKTSVIAPYPTLHPFEQARDEFESELWGKRASTIQNDEVSQLIWVENINELATEHRLDFSADVCIVFGTRKIKAITIQRLPRLAVNLHGGDPELYRGLDTHLWAIWHRHQQGLKTCLHLLSAELDEGQIVGMKAIDFKYNFSLKSLRSLNTSVCIDLCISFLEKVARGDEINTKKQKNTGRYYSFMHRDLKEEVLRIFENPNRDWCS